MNTLGFIGLGNMGTPMVSCLLQAGYAVTVWDINPNAIARLVELGAVAATSVQDVAAQTDCVITMLQQGEQVEQVCLGESGLFQHMASGAVYIDSSTIDVTTCRSLHQAASAQQILMCDAPVSGGVVGAEAAALTFMVGGEEPTFEIVQPILAAMGKHVIAAGSAGNGQVAKACNNMILAASMIAVSEGFKLADKLGLDAQTFYSIASTASSQCWSMTSYCPVPGLVDASPANRGYQAGFSGHMMLKDLLLSQQAAEGVHMVTALGQHATQLYADFVAQGHGDLDFSAIIQCLDTLSVQHAYSSEGAKPLEESEI